ncbi:MAG: hypothetical protein Q7K38_02635, partial [Candidatus Wildermuthbacteria bacterium]|nr:hypothetical protein [Candidatus Wildermuthbacteria bacterium]
MLATQYNENQFLSTVLMCEAGFHTFHLKKAAKLCRRGLGLEWHELAVRAYEYDIRRRFLRFVETRLSAEFSCSELSCFFGWTLVTNALELDLCNRPHLPPPFVVAF